MMWEIIEGQIPYGNLDNAQVIQHVCENRLTLPEPNAITSKELPEILYHIMKACWAYNPLDRPSFENLNKQFKEIDKDMPLKISAVNTMQTNSEAYANLHENSNNNNNIQDKYSRYSKINRSVPHEQNQPSQVSYGNKFNS